MIQLNKNIEFQEYDDYMEIQINDGYETDEINSFRQRFDFELYYWWNLRKLKSLLDNEFEIIRPFTNKDHY